MIFGSGNHNFCLTIPQAKTFGHPNFKRPTVSVRVFVYLIIWIMFSLLFCFQLFFCRFAKRAIRPNILLPNYNYYNFLNWWKCTIKFTNLVAYGNCSMEHRQLVKENSFTWLEVHCKLKIAWLPSNLWHVSLPLCYTSSMQREFWNIFLRKSFWVKYRLFWFGSLVSHCLEHP